MSSEMPSLASQSASARVYAMTACQPGVARARRSRLRQRTDLLATRIGLPGRRGSAVFASTQVTGSAAEGVAFGSVVAVRMLPALVLGPVAGVVADRWNRRYTMVVCDLVRFVMFASIPAITLITTNSKIIVGWAAVATFIIEAMQMAWGPAKDAAVPNLLPRARLESANQLTLATTYGVTPVLAGLFLAALTTIVNELHTT